MIEIDVDGQDLLPGSAQAVDAAQVITAVLDEAGLEHGADTVSISLRLVERDESAALNGAWRNKAYATNVLSVPAEVMLPGFRALGDLVICVPVIEAEASEQDKTLAAHFTHMLVHGTFHLLGHDHIADDEAEIMEAAERRVMARLGHGDPYAPAVSA